MITGSLVALVTPLLADGEVDFLSLQRLVSMQVESGTKAIVVMGTTGESPTLDPNEHEQVIARCIEFVDGRIPVVAGVGSNSTKEAVHLARAAKRAGAVSGLSVVPYYNKPTQLGMYQHFERIFTETGLPQILYNIPARTVCDMTNETILRLANLEGIVGVKDATGNMGRLAELAAYAPPDFALYAGDDDSSLAFMLAGGHGTISVTANLVPKLVSDLCDAAVRGDAVRARELNRKLVPLNKVLGLQTNPIVVKYAMEKRGLIGPGIRMPMTRLEDKYHGIVDEVLARL
ncbi:MAG: hypothetical protein RJA70_1008 [Pseudomonadota bacterium]|jgi:4-hydroxy-tetrahydrodipicolinate synthase